ncbi:LAETG motif-containing sortase-dependent surface protein [Streptomyces sp. NPDC052236]|uniref:LAETG motif-containing sortase-dependent surface protein n=1 Tax=Streptomyces sp. NPDC052236 TaxID=3365686 RepID=UPI0037D0736A
MRTHLSSRFAPSRFAPSLVATRAVVSAGAVLLTVVTPVTVAGAATAQPAAAPVAAAADTTAAPGLTTIVSTDYDSYELGRRNAFVAVIKNGTSKQVKGQHGLITIAYGKHVNAALEAMTPDASKVIVEHLSDGVWERLPITAGKNSTVQAAFSIADGNGGTLAPGGTSVERFNVTIDRSIPADANMGEISVGAYANGTAMHTMGFSFPRTQTLEPEVSFGGLASRPELVTGGKPVEFTATVTNNTGKDLSPADDSLSVSPDRGGDIDPQHVTVERRDSSGTWVPVTLSEKHPSLIGDLDKGTLKQGASRTYALRLSLTKHFPSSVNRGQFWVWSKLAGTPFDFTVKHEGAGTPDPSVNRDLTVTTQGLAGATALKRGGAAKEFTATVTNKGNISQQPIVLMEITDKDIKRRMQAGELSIQQYVKAAATGWKSVKVTTSTENGHLMAAIVPREGSNDLIMAPGDSAAFQLRIAATDTNKASAFRVDLEARAKLSATRISLPFTVSGAAATATPSQTPQPGTAVTVQPVNAANAGTAGNPTTGEMAQTGSDSTTPLLIGAGGLLVALGAGAVLTARRRAF